MYTHIFEIESILVTNTILKTLKFSKSRKISELLKNTKQNRKVWKILRISENISSDAAIYKICIIGQITKICIRHKGVPKAFSFENSSKHIFSTKVFKKSNLDFCQCHFFLLPWIKIDLDYLLFLTWKQNWLRCFFCIRTFCNLDFLNLIGKIFMDGI